MLCIHSCFQILVHCDTPRHPTYSIASVSLIIIIINVNVISTESVFRGMLFKMHHVKSYSNVSHPKLYMTEVKPQYY